MMNVAATTTAATMLGCRSSAPIYISACAKGGLADRQGELALCRAAHAQDVVQMAPHFSTRTLEEIAAARSRDQPHWLQIYVEKDRARTAELIERAEALGYTALFITVDSAGVSKNETDLRLTPGGNTTTAATTAAK
jgi:L-lactate dehydrogenase (cytochrome)